MVFWVGVGAILADGHEVRSLRRICNGYEGKRRIRIAGWRSMSNMDIGRKMLQ